MRILSLVLLMGLCLPVPGQSFNTGNAPLPAVLTPANNFASFSRFTNAAELLSAYFPGSVQTNVQFLTQAPAKCPEALTNVIANTNLFSSDERMLIEEIPVKYKNVTSDSPPHGAVLVGTDHSYPLLPDAFLIRRFQFTNSSDLVEIIFYTHGKAKAKPIGVSFRTKDGDGYEELFNQTFRQFKHGKLDGLWADFDRNHCSAWLRFANGMAVGKWYLWNRSGDIYMAADFKQPFDFIGQLNFGLF
jgi:hypothetical protein